MIHSDECMNGDFEWVGILTSKELGWQVKV